MARKKAKQVEQLSLFENPKGPTAAQFKEDLMREFRASKGAYLQEAKKKRKRNRGDSIFLPEDQRSYQDSFLVQPVYPYPEWCFPPVSTKPESVTAILRAALEMAALGAKPRIGLDFEFSPEKHKISIIGVADVVSAAACRWSDDFLPLLYRCIDEGVAFVGHWVLGADKFELENAAREAQLSEILARPNGYLTPRSGWLDSMGLHYLCNQALCKAPGKESDEDGSLGYMGIGSALFLSSSIPAGYKHCRGTGCTGPCPRCRVFDYCAIDAFSGLIIAENCLKVMQEKSIPFSCYEFWAELTMEVCLRAERTGVLVDKPFIDNFGKHLDSRREKLFPHENSAYKHFNPQSGKQVLEYFDSHGIYLRDTRGKPSTVKKVILDAVEQEIKKYGVSSIDEFERSDDHIVLSEVDEMLYNLLQYKESGKGLEPWFSEEKRTITYHDGEWWIHPRFVTTGASTGRLSSARPNFQNMGNADRGWRKEARKAIIANRGCQILTSDASQLELRCMLYFAGADTRKIIGDAFTWLVEKANGGFDRIAATIGKKARDLAKKGSHASNYLIGFKTYDEWQLKTKRTHQQILDGSLIVFEDWLFHGKVVGFTGAHLAFELFGDKTDISRRKALNLQFGVYFKEFNIILDLLKKILKEVETGVVRLPSGHCLELLDSPDSNAKAGAAYFGQGGGAIFMNEKAVKANRLWPDIPIGGLIHDEIFRPNIPLDWPKDRIKKVAAHLEEADSDFLPNLWVPFKSKVGPSWGEMEELK